MKNQFKILLLMLITSTVIYAQKSSAIEMDEKHTIYKENFTTNDNTILVLNLNNTKAQIFQSPDDKVYIEYTKEFKNTRKKRIQTQLKLIIVSGKKEGNKITYSSKLRNTTNIDRYGWEDLMIDRSEKKKFLNLNDSVKKPVERKSLDSVLYEIKGSDSLYRNKLFGALKIKPRVKKWKKSDQIIITKMNIKIPKNIRVRATLENSNVVFIDDFYNPATMNIRNSKLRFKKIDNPLNIFDVDNGYFWASDLSSGKFSFANVRQLMIGELSNTVINSEFTQAEIGEIGKGNKIIDFNSEYFFYNWTNDFQRFDLFSEYSKIHFFYPDLNHNLEVIGYNTRNIVGDDGFEVTMQPKSKERNRLMSKPSNPEEKSSGLIFFDIVNGIIYSHNDSIKSINKD